jgi:hypothetical protein
MVSERNEEKDGEEVSEGNEGIGDEWRYERGKEE